MATPAVQNTTAEPTLVATAKAYLDAISKLDTNCLSSLLSKQYQHQFASGLADLGPPVGSDDFCSRFETLRVVLRSFPTIAKQVWANAAANQVTVWAKRDADFHPSIRGNDGDDVWKFHGEYIFILTMNPRGDKVDSALEFVDSKETERMKVLIGEAFQRKQEMRGNKEAIS